MKNPLNKRYLRELKGDIGKYLVIFIFMILFVGVMSGFFVAGTSVIRVYEKSHEELKLEDGHIAFDQIPEESILAKIEKSNDLKLYPLFYKEEKIEETGNTIRIYAERDKVDLVGMYDGNNPSGTDEIALDRMYADNNGLSIGDTITLKGQTYKISGTVALPDYSAMYENNNDMMFDSVNFGVAIMSKAGYEAFESIHETYNYAWKYDQKPVDDTAANKRFEEFSDSLKEIITEYDQDLVQKQVDELHEIDEEPLLYVDDILPEYLNQAINFVGTDGTSDRASAQMMTYIIMLIVAFIFAITISNTISKEAAVIGTLRASGYSKAELVRHYMVLPVVVTLLGCGIGNILGYTFFSNVFRGVYYGSYSLPVYESYFNANAFVQTTVIPLILMVVINLFVLIRKLRIKPLNFLRGELKVKTRKASAARLPYKLPFMFRFSLRILFQNIPSYLTLAVGIVVAGILAVFGFMFVLMIEDYGKLINETKICEYQYVLINQVEIENTQVEKFCINSLETTFEDFLADDVSVYGIENDSKYISANVSEGKVLISNAAAEKYNLGAGDEFVVKEKYGDETYTFIVGDVYVYDAAIAVFMPREDYISMFDEEDGYFNGYFSNEVLTDLDSDDIATVIDTETLTKVTNQMSASFGNFMVVFQALGAGIFLLLMFILTKQIIEKNVKSISMTKILGFTNGEIGKLYLAITSAVIIASLLVSIPIIDQAIEYIMTVYMYKRISGYLPDIVSSSCYAKTVIMGITCYLLVALGMMIKIRRLPKGEVLKNQNL